MSCCACSIIERDRELKRQHVLAKAMQQRAEKLRPFYDALQEGVASASARSIFPPFSNFLLSEHAKPLYEPEDADPTPADFNEARQGVLSDADVFAHSIQCAFLGRLVKAHMDLRKLESSVVTSLSLYADAPVLGAHEALAVAREICSVVKCTNGCCWTYATFPAILDHIKVCNTSPLAEDDLTTTPTQIAAVRHIVESASEPVAGTSTASLYAHGAAFECAGCAPKYPLLGSAQWSNAYNKTLDWAKMVSRFRSFLFRSRTYPMTFLGPSGFLAQASLGQARSIGQRTPVVPFAPIHAAGRQVAGRSQSWRLRARLELARVFVGSRSRSRVYLRARSRSEKGPPDSRVQRRREEKLCLSLVACFLVIACHARHVPSTFSTASASLLIMS